MAQTGGRAWSRRELSPEELAHAFSAPRPRSAEERAVEERRRQSVPPMAAQPGGIIPAREWESPAG